MPSSDFYSNMKLREMLQAVAPPGPRPPSGLSGLDLATSQPRYFDQQGQTITTIPCGTPYSFEVPGYTSVWLRSKKDGVLVYDAMFRVPLLNYSASCAADVGSYVVEAFDPIDGHSLGSTSLTITGAPGSSVLGDSTWLLVAGGALLFLMMRKR